MYGVFAYACGSIHGDLHLKYRALLALVSFLPRHGIARRSPRIEATCEGVHFRKTMLADFLCRTGTGSPSGSGAVGNNGQPGRNLVQALLYFLRWDTPGVRQFNVRRFPSLGLRVSMKTK